MKFKCKSHIWGFWWFSSDLPYQPFPQICTLVSQANFLFLVYYHIFPLPAITYKVPSAETPFLLQYFVHPSRPTSNACLPQALCDPPDFPEKSLLSTHAKPNAGLVNLELNHMLPSCVTCWHIQYRLPRIPARLSGVLRNPWNICEVKKNFFFSVSALLMQEWAHWCCPCTKQLNFKTKPPIQFLPLWLSFWAQILNHFSWSHNH